MKKLLTILFVFVAIASFGGNIAVTKADTLTPAQAAAFQQTLDSLKAKLLDLQAQANAQASSQPPVVSGAPLTLQNGAVLSSLDAASLRSTLTLLATALTNLQLTIAQNPQLTAGREGVVLLTLKGIGTTLASIGTTITGSSPVAIATPNAPATPAAPPTETAPLLSAGGESSPAAATPANAAPQTAQAGSSWSFKNLNWPLVVIIVLVLIAVALWLFWPGEEDRGRTKRKAAPQLQPSAPPKTPIVTSAAPLIPPVSRTTPQASQTAQMPSQVSQASPQQRKPA